MEFVVVLRGILEVQTTNSKKRRWNAERTFIADETRGKEY
jgi:hypothetical protein